MTQGIEQLSAREREILARVAHGETNFEIAASLLISPNTVKAHVANILAKLSVPTRHQAARVFWDRSTPPG